MIILSIETSCDETAVSLVEAHGDFPNAKYKILGNALFSQVDIHREYGGVFPAVAKREHVKTLVPMLQKALNEAGMLREKIEKTGPEHHEKLHEILHREEGLADALTTFNETYEQIPIDLIAVTNGPGLEPALWVGVNFAKALSYLWNVPLVPVNHMEGHVLASIFDGTRVADVQFPALSLLISGGHTELVKIETWGSYEIIGETRDDAVGEAFDKVARMIGLPYPGGPEIGARAQSARENNLPEFAKLPRPMLDSPDLDFSFSGLKTAVRYAIEGKELSDDDVASISREFEDAVVEVLVRKTQKAIEQHDIKTVIVGGGVSANKQIKKVFAEHFGKEFPEVKIYFPPQHFSTDNSVMIALAGHANMQEGKMFHAQADVKADGNLSIA